MILYEIQSDSATATGRVCNVEYKSTQALALKLHNGYVKTGSPRVVTSKVTVRTNLVQSDWIDLLTGDARGMTCELTPQDLITDREVLRAHGT